MKRSLSALRDLIDGHFNLDEVRSLCLNLSLDYDNLAGVIKRAKIESLLGDLDKRGRLAELIDLLEEERPNVDWAVGPPEGQPNPYRGLAAFREEDADLFFGREEISRELLAAVENQPLVAIIGPSGSGKSSLVFAGLLPRLSRQDEWAMASFRPGPRPFRSLAAALLPFLEPELSEVDRLVETKKLAGAFEKRDLDLWSVVDRALEMDAQAAQLLLLIDQFEELYTLCHDDQVRGDFLDLLLAVVDEGDAKVNVTLAITLRADFMGQVLSNGDLADAFQNRVLMLGPMSRDGLTDVVEQPAFRSGAVFEAGLVERLLNDVGAAAQRRPEPGNLPLLEFALTLLWERQEAGRLTHEAYEAIGQVRGALARHAEAIFEKLDTDEQEQARRVFMQMVQPGLGTEDTRRLATDEELGREGWLLARRLAGPDARLVVAGTDESDHETAEIIHEALIQRWGRLQGWLKSDRAFRLWQERLRLLLAQWEDSDRDQGALLRGAPLAEAEGWLAEQAGDLSQAERAFIEASVAQREREKSEREARRQQELATLQKLAETEQARAAAEQQRADEQEKAASRLRRRNYGLIGALVVAALLVLVARLSLIQSDQNKVEAEEKAVLANARWLAAQGQSESEENPLLGLGLVLEGLALVEKEEPEIQESVLANGRREVFQWGRQLKLGDDVEWFWPSQDGSIMIVARENAPVEVRRSADGELLAEGTGEAEHITFSTDEAASIFVIHYVDARGEVRRSTDGELLANLLGQVERIAFSPDENASIFVVRYESGPSEVRRSEDGALLAKLPGKEYEITFSPDSSASLFVIDYYDAPGEVRRSDDGELLAKLPDQVNGVDFSHDAGASIFMVSYRDAPGEARRSADGELLYELTDVSNRIIFSPDQEASLFVVEYRDAPTEVRRSADGAILFEQTQQIYSITVSRDEHASIFAVDFREAPGELRRSDDGKLLAELKDEVDWITFNREEDALIFVVSYRDAPGEVRRSADGELLADLPGPVEEITFSPDDSASIFVVSYRDAPGEVRRSANGELLVDLPGPVEESTFSPDDSASIFVVNYEDAPGEVRRSDDGELLAKLPDRVNWVNFRNDEGASIFVVDYLDTASEVRRSDDGELLAKLTGDKVGIRFSPDEDASTFVIHYSDAPSEVRRSDDGELLAKLTGETVDISFSPDEDASLFVVEYLDAPKEIRRSADGSRLDGLTGLVDWIFYSPDEAASYFVVLYEDGRSELWSRDNLVRLASLDVNIDDFFFSDENERLIVGHEDNRAYIVDLTWLQDMNGQVEQLPIDRLVSIACRTLSRSSFDPDSLIPFLDQIGIKIPQACR